MNRKISLGITLALMLIAAAIAATLTTVVNQKLFDEKLESINERRAMFTKLSEIDSKVRGNFIGEIDEKLLEDMTATGYMLGLQNGPSMYLTAEETAALNSNISGSAVGIGAMCTKNPDGNIYVYRVVKDSPAKLAGLCKGDIITAVDGKPVTELGYREAVAAIRGEANTGVTLKVLREGEEQELSAVRNNYVNYSVIAEMLGTTGIVTITEFNQNTDEQFIGAMKALEEKGVTSLVFDVRGNSGGVLESVCAMLDYLLPEGTVLSKTTLSGTKIAYVSDSQQVDLPMVVLIDDVSASASELFACALRDSAGAKLVGVQSYGKGSVQTMMALSDGSSINVTTAKFNPPKSANFDGVGLTPDIIVELTEEQKEDFYFLSIIDDSQLVSALTELEVPDDAMYEEVDYKEAETYVPLPLSAEAQKLVDKVIEEAPADSSSAVEPLPDTAESLGWAPEARRENAAEAA